ncbi:MAG: hypothetical protein WD071_15695 [Pseudohongiella sp.]|uniref:hypothetical protein n=1 Tax=Pseudohongiella sp. TaxID=1979412 RepID=UPI0034A008EA
MTVFYWQHIHALWAGAATLAMLVGIGLIYRSWRWHKRGGLIPGWGILALSLAGWSIAGGTWIGLPVGISVLMVLIITWIAVQGQWPMQTRTTAQRTGQGGAAAVQSSPAGYSAVPARTWLRGGARFLVAGPLAALFALTTSLLLAQLLMSIDADRVFTERLAVTLIWTAGMAWACTATRLTGPTIIMTSSTVLALTLLLLLH